MFEIPFQSVNMTTFPDPGLDRRFGKPKAFYITIDDTNAFYETYSIATDSSDDESVNETISQKIFTI